MRPQCNPLMSCPTLFYKYKYCPVPVIIFFERNFSCTAELRWRNRLMATSKSPDRSPPTSCQYKIVSQPDPTLRPGPSKSERYRRPQKIRGHATG